VLRAIDVSKSYGAIRAALRASLVLERARIHAIVGENGAGKSTLLNICAGVAAPDEGRVEVAEKRLDPHTAAAGIRAGVGMVAQHFSLVEPLTALENIVLGHEPGGVLVDFDAARAKAERVLRELGIELDLDRTVSDLGVGDKQRLEIARVLFRDAQIVILDEPTAVLAPQEVDALYAMLERLAKAGRTIAVVTHKLDEVYEHADVVTVMRRGKILSTQSIDRSRVQTDVTQALAREIMGDEKRAGVGAGARTMRTPGPDAIVVDALVVSPRLRGATMRVRTGEIIGVCGIEGSGQDELVMAIAGIVHVTAGHVRLPGSDRAAVVLADRHRDGLVLDATVCDNAILGEHRAFARVLIDAARARSEAQSRIDRAKVVPPNVDLFCRALSGGNQQKIVVERACARADGKRIRALVLHHPTRGVDIGAARAIHDRISEVAARGVGVLILGSDIDELRGICDRMLVMARGKIAGDVPKDATAQRIGELMLGGA